MRGGFNTGTEEKKKSSLFADDIIVFLANTTNHRTIRTNGRIKKW